MEVWHMHLWPSVPALCIKSIHLCTDTASRCLAMLISQVDLQSSGSLLHIQHGLYYALIIGHHLYGITESHCPSGIQLFELYRKTSFSRNWGKTDLFLVRTWLSTFSFLEHSKKLVCIAQFVISCSSTLSHPRLLFSFSLIRCWNPGILAF